MRASWLVTLVLCLPAAPAFAQAAPQQIVQRGAFGRPASVYDETEQWTQPISVGSDKESEIYIPDVTAAAWLQRNYADFQSRGTYTLSFFTHYKSEAACRHNQIAWGLGDAEHLNACAAIGYRLRQVHIDPQQKSVTLQMIAMLDLDGNIVPGSTQQDSTFRTWDQIDPLQVAASEKANDLVTRQMALYDRKVRRLQQ